MLVYKQNNIQSSTLAAEQWNCPWLGGIASRKCCLQPRMGIRYRGVLLGTSRQYVVCMLAGGPWTERMSVKILNSN